jgi:hypothetical protein
MADKQCKKMNRENREETKKHMNAELWYAWQQRDP